MREPGFMLIWRIMREAAVYPARGTLAALPHLSSPNFVVQRHPRASVGPAQLGRKDDSSQSSSKNMLRKSQPVAARGRAKAPRRR
jgi:hypothetical protein